MRKVRLFGTDAEKGFEIAVGREWSSASFFRQFATIVREITGTA